MAINPLIALQTQGINPAPAIQNLQNTLVQGEQLQMQRQQNERQDRLLSLRERQVAGDLIQQNFDRLQAQEKRRIRNTAIGSHQLQKVLRDGGPEAARQWLQNNADGNSQFGLPSGDTQEALKMLDAGKTEQLQTGLDNNIYVGEQLGLIKPGSEPQQFESILDNQGNPIAQRNTATGRVVSDPRAPDSPSTEVNIDNRQGPQVGTIPQGWQLNYDDQGRPVSMTPIPGGPAEREQQKAKEQAKSKRAQTERYADVVTEDIDRALGIVEKANVPVTGVGSYLSSIPGTPARDLKGLVDTIRANVGFDRLQQMRDASPTGGALGQVSELENRLLQATLGNLELSQSEEQFKRNLTRVKDIYTTIINEGIPEKKAKVKLKEIKKERPPGGSEKSASEMTDKELLEGF